MTSSSSFSCRLFSLFSSPCCDLLVVEQKSPGFWPGLSNHRRGIARASALNLVRLDVMVKDVGVQANTSIPGNGGGFRIDAHFLELAHVAPQLEGADLEQVAEEHAPFEAVFELRPQLVVFLGLAAVMRIVSSSSFMVIPSSARRRSGT